MHSKPHDFLYLASYFCIDLLKRQHDNQDGIRFERVNEFKNGRVVSLVCMYICSVYILVLCIYLGNGEERLLTRGFDQSWLPISYRVDTVIAFLHCSSWRKQFSPALNSLVAPLAELLGTADHSIQHSQIQQRGTVCHTRSSNNFCSFKC